LKTECEDVELNSSGSGQGPVRNIHEPTVSVKVGKQGYLGGIRDNQLLNKLYFNRFNSAGMPRPFRLLDPDDEDTNKPS
jgi:hypothetical protein